MSEKSVDEKIFKECCNLMLCGRMHPDVCAYLTGLSRATFNKRVNQYYDPDRYGKLPDNFFDGHKEDGYENSKWYLERPAVKKYLERQKWEEERKRQKAEYEQIIKHRDEFMSASELPKLGD